MRVKIIFKLMVLFTLVAIGQEVRAQLPSGRIVGRVTDASTGDFLPGANVILLGTNLGAASDRYGYYRIENVPVGNYRLQVKYIGYKDFETDVRVSDVGQTVKLDIALEVSAVEIGEVVVEGLREGQVKALTQQMNAPNIKNVLAREEMERFPDLNTAEVLQRIPGIAVQRSLGEGRFVNIRGTEPRLSNV
ncbi:MAG: TonB-dependent receptor, partial [Calditrichaeota bacterium]